MTKRRRKDLANRTLRHVADAARATEFVLDDGPVTRDSGDAGAIVMRPAIDARREGTERVRVEGGRTGKPINRPIAALDAHLDLLRWVSSPGAREPRIEWWRTFYGIVDKRGQVVHYADGYANLLGDGEGNVLPDDPRYAEAVDAMGLDRWQTEVHLLANAPTLYVTPDMVELALAIAEAEMANPSPLRSTDPWAPMGLIVLSPPGLDYWAPEGEHTASASGRLPVQYIGWDVTSVGRRTSSNPVEATTPGQGVGLWTWAAPDTCAAAWDADAEQLRQWAGPAMLIDHTAWAENAPWEATTSAHGEVRDDGTVMAAVHVARLRSWVRALWKLLDEEVAVAERERDAHVGRRARRMGRLPRLDGDVVRVVRLRKYVDAETGEPLTIPQLARRFTHRWWVRAHWRHLGRGDGYLDGDQLLLNSDLNWEPGRDQAEVHLNLIDADGRQERVTIATITEGLATLTWPPRLVQGVVEVERLARVREHTSGAEFGLVIERYDVVSVER